MDIKDFYPTNPSGYHPGKEFADLGNYDGIRVGVVNRVDEINMKCDVRILTGGGERYEIDITQGLAGPRSFLGGVPEEGSLVILGFRRKHKQLWEAMILGFLPVGNRSGLRFDPTGADDPSNVTPEDASLYSKVIGNAHRVKRLKLKQGDLGGMSASGAEWVLTRDFRATNRAGDLIELRDGERTLVEQSIHRVESASGVKVISGPVRRVGFLLPLEVYKDPKTGVLKGESDRYFGQDELSALGPGEAGTSGKYANDGKVNEKFLEFEGSTVIYANGKRAFYPSATYGYNVPGSKAGNQDEVFGDAFTEHRMELRHQTDMTQDVLGEIDGFDIGIGRTYIERVLGTVVGNDNQSTRGMREYGKVLRPQLWTSFQATTKGRFEMVEATGDTELTTSAASFLYRMSPPQSRGEDDVFAVAVEKQGKLYLNVPKPSVEKYPDDQGVSAEMNFAGALKMFLGATSPNKVSLNVTMEGGIKADIGHNSDTGNAIDVTFHSGVFQRFLGSSNETGNAIDQDVQGNIAYGVSGDVTYSIDGSFDITASNVGLRGDRVNLNGLNGLSFNGGEFAMMVSGKGQMNFGQQVQETIATGGRLNTILTGGLVENVVAGAVAYNTLAGATTFNNPAGAFNITVGTGAISITTASGAVAISAAAGAVTLNSGLAMTLTAGLAMNLSATTMISMVSPQILFGGPAAVLGVVRGTPALPPGTPSLDYITGLPLLGSALVRSV
jgi:hypothetical protein